jgi:hypothetical protein
VRSVGQDVGEAHERDELEQLGRRVTKSHLAPVPPRPELEPRKRVDRDRIGRHGADVAEGKVGSAPFEQRADAVAEPGQVGTGDRAFDGEDNGVGPYGGHPGEDSSPLEKSSASDR